MSTHRIGDYLIACPAGLATLTERRVAQLLGRTKAKQGTAPPGASPLDVLWALCPPVFAVRAAPGQSDLAKVSVWVPAGGSKAIANTGIPRACAQGEGGGGPRSCQLVPSETGGPHFFPQSQIDAATRSNWLCPTST